MRPILRGRDIKRYGYNWANLWLIYIPWHFPYQFDESIQGASEKAERAFQEQYPAVYEHLLQYKEDSSKYKGNVADVSNIIRVGVTTLTTTPDLYVILQFCVDDSLIFQH